MPTYTVSKKPKLLNYATWDRRILKKINTARRMQVNPGRTTTYGKPQEKNNQTRLDPLTFFSKIMPERSQGSRGGQKYLIHKNRSALELIYLRPVSNSQSKWSKAPQCLKQQRLSRDWRSSSTCLWQIVANTLLWLYPSFLTVSSYTTRLDYPMSIV